MPSSYRDHIGSHTMGMSLALLGVFLMSFDPIFIRYAGISGPDTVFLFGLFTAISMPILLALREKRPLSLILKASGWPLIAASTLMLISSATFVTSVKHTSIANTFIILSITPVFSALASYLLLKEKLDKSTWLTISIIVAGVFIVAKGSINSGNGFGDLLAFVSVFSLALLFVLLRKYQKVSRLAAVGLAGALIAITMFPLATPSQYSSDTWLIMAIMGLFSAPLGRVLSMTATQYISAAEVSMTMVLETVLATLWAFIFFNETPNSNSLIGGGIILSAIIVYTGMTMKKPPLPSANT